MISKLVLAAMLMTTLVAFAAPPADAWTCNPDPQHLCQTAQDTAYPVVRAVLDAVDCLLP